MRVRLVPPWVVGVIDAVDGWDDGERAAVGASYRRLGQTAELDLDLLSEQGYGELAERLDAYRERCVAFWVNGGHGEALHVRRPLTSRSQIDRRGEPRVDLVDELVQLRALPGVGDFVDAWLAAGPDTERIARAAGAAGAHYEITDGRGTAEITVDGANWPAVLGGTASVGEVARVFLLEANWSAWRDRDVRRLTRVSVEAEEVWPAPTVVRSGPTTHG